MSSFAEEMAAAGAKLEEQAARAVDWALKAGADECEVVIGNSSGVDVSSRHLKTENVSFNKNRSMAIVVYKNKCSGTAATTDLSDKSIQDCINAAVQIAADTDADPCNGICDKELLCTEVKDFGLLHPMFADTDKALELAIATEEAALSRGDKRIKDSDGAWFSSELKNRVLANSHGFCKSQAFSGHSFGLTLIGEQDGRMQRGSGFAISTNYEGLADCRKVADEAFDETVARLGAVKPQTGRCNIIFTKGAARSLWGHLRSAISGQNIYLKSSFLCGRLNEQILPSFLTVHEDPHVYGQMGSRSFDSDGAATYAQDWVKDGVLQEYLLASYSSRKLSMKNNAHAGGTGCLYIQADSAHTKTLDDLMAEAGEGLVIDQLMGQGVDIVSGNYSRGAAGFYFKNGRREHAVHELTIAANLKDIFMNIAAVGTDIDERYRIKTGSILIPDLTVSAN